MRSAFVLLALCSGLGCAHTQAVAPVKPSSPFTEADLRLFDDGVDPVGDPDSLGGRWADDWNLEMRDRVQRSDMIALVEIDTLKTDIDPESRTTHRLVVKVDKVMKGSTPRIELQLASADSSAGFNTVEANKGRLLGMQMLALIKWFEEPDGSIGSHFHLASASDKVLTRVQAHMERGAPSQRTVTEHQYDSSKGEKAPESPP